ARHTLPRRRIEDAVIERLKPDPNVLTVHAFSDSATLRSLGRARHVTYRPRFVLRLLLRYSVIDTTTPAPTVLPPSRIAKRCFSSIAIGVISSPPTPPSPRAISISAPAGSVTCPATSVVRK